MTTAKKVAASEAVSRDFNIVAQLVHQKTGSRTPPITKTRREFANTLRDLIPPTEQEKSFVLVLADDSVTPGSLDFALAPLMTVQTFIEHFADKGDLGDKK